MENNNNNGRGIFYGVIGVATLIVAIIGATFAYFSATANSATNAVTASGANVSLTWNEDPNGLQTNLIPVDVTQSGFLTTPGNTATDCHDQNSNVVCSTYTFTVTNPDTNTAAQRIYAQLKPVSNTFTNLHFAMFKGTAADVKSGSVKFDVDGTAVTTDSNPTKHIIGANGDLVITKTKLTKNSTAAIDLNPVEQVLGVGESVTYTIVLWIDETGEAQNEDQGQAFAGGVFITTEKGSGTGITGVLAA